MAIDVHGSKPIAFMASVALMKVPFIDCLHWVENNCATNHDIQNNIIQCRIDGHLFQGIERPEIFLLGKAIMTNYQKVWQQGPCVNQKTSHYLPCKVFD